MRKQEKGTILPSKNIYKHTILTLVNFQLDAQSYLFIYI